MSPSVPSPVALDSLLVDDLQYSVYPDGPLAGHPTVVVKFGVKPWRPAAETEIFDEAERLAGGPCLITLAGIDPAGQSLEHLILLGQARGYTFALETNGNSAPEWLELLDYLIVNPQAPSTGVPTNYKTLHHVIGAGLAGKPKLSIKVAVQDDADFAFAEMIHELFPPVDFYVSAVCPGTSRLDGTPVMALYSTIEQARWLAETVLDRQQPDMRISIHLPDLLWGTSRTR